MNTLKFDVYKNTLKRRDGFNPVLGEKKYSKIKCYFTDNDWDNCSLVTANFMTDKDNVVKNTVSLTEDKTAVFDIPANLDGGKIYFSVTGSCTSDAENTTTLNTNIIGIDRQKGMLPSATTDMNLFEKIIGLVNSVVLSLKSTLQKFIDNYPNVDASNLSLLNVKSLGVKNDGEETTLGLLSFYPLDNRTLYFPKGKYLCNGLALQDIENLTIICDNAEFIYFNKATDETDSAETSVQGSFFKFTNCKNLNIIGGTYDGQHKVSQCISLINCPKASISNPLINGAGNKASAFAAGINLIRDCSSFNLDNITVSDVKAGTVSTDKFIHAVGVGVSNVDGEFSQHGIINNANISNISGYSVGSQKPDGDGIYLIQKPSANCSGNSYITVKNCTITDCSKRGIKVSTRYVTIENCYIDVDSWGAAIEAQYGKMTLRDSTIINRYASCLTLDWDNGTNYIDNCKLYGADKDDVSVQGNGYTGNGIVLNQRLSVTGTYYTDEPCSVVVRNCTVDNVTSPLRSGYAAGLTYKYQSVIFENCQIGHYRGSSAIILDASMIAAINTLSLSNINYKFGTTESEVQSANNQYFGLTNSGNTLDIGTTSAYVNPDRLTYTNNLSDDYEQLFRYYNLNSDFGEEKVKLSEVLEDAPNSISCTNGTYTSATNTAFTVKADDGTLTVNCSTAFASASYVYVPIESLSLGGEMYDYLISSISAPNANVTITLADSKKNVINTSLEVSLNKASKSLIIGDISGTAAFVRVKLNSKSTASLTCKISLTARKKVLRGQIEARLKALEEKIKVLEGTSV